MAVGNGGEFAVTALVNKGGGRFGSSTVWAANDQTVPEAVAVADLNHDRTRDIVFADTNGRSVFVLLNATSRCLVPDVTGEARAVARRSIARAGCRVGAIRRVGSRVRRGHVISERPGRGTVLPRGGKIDLVVSRGRRPS
jgi:hypothetical protein